MNSDEKIEAIREIFDEYEGCRGCGLCNQDGYDRINTVFGQGNVDAEVMIIGDYPREGDEREATPFSETTPSGILLDRYLASMASSRLDVWIDLCVMCRPVNPDDHRVERPPNKEEVAACRSRLNRVIGIIDPKIILLLGRVPLRMAKKYGDVWDKTLTASRDSISKIAREENPPRLVVEVPGALGPVRYEARATFSPYYILRMKESDLRRQNSDNELAWKTWYHTFRHVDVINNIYRGVMPPQRGVSVE